MDSELRLICDYRYEKTNIEDLYYTPPYKIMHPFMDGKKMELILMSSSAGLLAGDCFRCNIQVKDRAYLSFLSQSYEKIFDTLEKNASRSVFIQVGSKATLKYLPLPAIPFANSSFVANSEIHLEESSTLVYSEVFSCGRVGMGEKFKMRSFHSKTKVYVVDTLVFADNTLLSPIEMDYEKLGMWGEFSHSGMLYIYCPDSAESEQELISEIKDIYEKLNILAGVSKCKKGLLVRSLGHSGDELHNLNTIIANCI